MSNLRPTEYEVTLGRRQDPVFGELWTLNYRGESVVTRGSEAVARAVARLMGWRIVEADDGMEGMP